MTQHERILKGLRRGPLTTYKAITECSVLCPWKRIQELRARGYVIDSEPFVRRRVGGKPVRMVRYRLISEPSRPDPVAEEGDARG